MANKTYTYQDLISAYLNVQRFKNAPPGLKEFHTELYRRLSTFFEVDFEKDLPGEDWRRESLRRLFHTTISRCRNVSDPFEGILEAPKEIADLYRIHGERLAELCRQLRRQYFALLCDLYKKMYGDRGRSITSKILKRQGFDDSTQPDESDYL